MIDLLNNMVESIRRFGIEKVFKRYYSFYPAKVLSTEDPEGRFRISVSVPSLFSDEALPVLAEPKDFMLSGPNKGHVNVPDVGDWVNVEFRNGDQRFPVYSGGWYATGEAPEGFTPTVRGFTTKYGHSVKYDDTEGQEKIAVTTPKGNFFVLDDTEGSEAVYLIHKSGAQLQISGEDGQISLITAKGHFLNMNTESEEVTAGAPSGAYASIGPDGVKLSDPSGETFLTVGNDGTQVNTSKDAIVNANTYTVNAGSVVIDTKAGALKIGSGKIALGVPGIELIDQVIQALDALVSAPTLCTTGTGPSSPLTPPAAVQLTLVKSMLTSIKGSI